MIFDKIENMSLYYSVLPELQMVAEYLKDFDPHTEPVKVEIDGDNLFVMVLNYETKLRDEGRYEGHRKYIDVQILVAGEEQMDIKAMTDDEEIETPYNGDNDLLFTPRSEPDAVLTLKPGLMTVLYPDDLHQPSIAMNEVPAEVKKLVVKIKIK